MPDDTPTPDASPHAGTIYLLHDYEDGFRLTVDITTRMVDLFRVPPTVVRPLARRELTTAPLRVGDAVVMGMFPGGTLTAMELVHLTEIGVRCATASDDGVKVYAGARLAPDERLVAARVNPRGTYGQLVVRGTRLMYTTLSRDRLEVVRVYPTHPRDCALEEVDVAQADCRLDDLVWQVVLAARRFDKTFAIAWRGVKCNVSPTDDADTLVKNIIDTLMRRTGDVVRPTTPVEA